MQKHIAQFLNWVRVPQHFALLVIALLPLYLVTVYMDNYGRHVPVNDQWFEPLDIAAAVQNGTFSLDLITRENYGHRAIFSYGVTALLSYTTHWDVILEIYVSLVLAILRFILIVLIFREYAPHLTHLILIPFSLLIFSTYQYLIWLSGIYSVWHFVSLFLLAAVWILLHFPVGWRSLAGAAFFACCAAFSQGSGTVVFAVLAITLWMFGYRRWTYYAFWLGLMALALWLYFSGSGVALGGETAESSSTINLANLDIILRFIFAYLGNPFTYNLDMDLPVRIGQYGLVMVVANMAYLWWRGRDWRVIAVWMTLTGFASSIAITVYVTRYIETRFIYAIEQRYALISTHLWLAYVGTALITCWSIWHDEHKKLLSGVLLPLNIVFGVLLSALYLQATVWNLQVTAYRYSHAVGYDFIADNEDACIRNFPLRRDFTCAKETFVGQIGNATDEAVYKLAVHHLTVFADEHPVFVLPESYHTNSPIIIDSPSRWLNAYIREWMLPGVDEKHIFHIAPEPQQYPIDDLRNPLTDVYADYTLEMLNALGTFINGAEQVWYIRTSETQKHEAIFSEFLELKGYIALYVPIQDERYRDADFTVIRYLLAPQETEDLFFFGDDIALQSFNLQGSSQVEGCESVTLQSWWMAYNVPDRNYSATLILVNEAGEKVAQQDGALAGIEMQVWVPELPYLDERTLTIPCDLPAGEYELQFGIYDFATFENLLITHSGQEIGIRAPILNLTVQ